MTRHDAATGNPAPPRTRCAVRVTAYVFAACIGLGLLPTAFAVTDRATVLRLSNDVLDMVSR